MSPAYDTELVARVTAGGRRVRSAMCRQGVLLCFSLLLLTQACVCDDESDVSVKLGIVMGVESAQIVKAAVEKEGITIERGSEISEPGEEGAVALATCEHRGHDAAILGGTIREATVAAGAAARLGLPLLLVDEVPANHTWEALALHPGREVLVKATQQLVQEKGWSKTVLLHEGPPDAAPLLAPDDDIFNLTARALPPPGDRDMLKRRLQVLKKQEFMNFLVWCSTEYTESVLETAQQVGILSEKYSYILMTLDAHTLDLEPYSHGGANITTLSVFDRTHPLLQETKEQWMQRLKDIGMPEEDIPKEMSTAVVLAIDGAELMRNASTALKLKPGLQEGNCDTGIGAAHASTLLNYIRSRVWNALSGRLVWDGYGERVAVTLHISELHRTGELVSVGSYSAAGLQWARSDPPLPPPRPDVMTNRTFNVLIALSKPYIMRRESTGRLTGNDEYEGYCVELIDKLAQFLHFNYTLIMEEGGNYDNMLRRLQKDEDIHFAITDLTITAAREKMVDFTTPFMNLGISILLRKPRPPEPKTFAFLDPFDVEVWVCLGVAYVATSLVLYLVGRLCPEEWQNPYPCIEEPVALDNQFTLANALWFNLGAVLLQGSEIAPVAYGTRAVASVWWIFALVITSSYTANLATLLAKKQPNDQIHNVQELADNNLNITYGAKAKGATYNYFQQSQNSLYQRMFKEMPEDDQPTTNEEGIKKVVEHDYAFFMESTSIEYETQRNCNVTQVGGLLDSKGYGLAMKKDSPLRQALNLALLNFQEEGVLRDMKDTWWNKKNGGGACNVPEDLPNEPLEMNNFRGLFLVLIVGCALGIVGSCVDLGLAARKRARAINATWGRCFVHELRFVFQFSRSVKPVRASLTPSPLPTTPSASTPTPPSPSPPLPSPRSASQSFRRRRSSLHAASVRLTRHTRPSDAAS